MNLDQLYKGMDLEYSFISLKDPIHRLELRAAAEGGMPELTGYPIVWGSRSRNMGGFVEIVPRSVEIVRGNEDADIRSFYNHDMGNILARESTGRLTTKKDDHGLQVSIRPVDTQYARDMVACIESGELRGMSVIRRTLVDEWDDNSNPAIRLIHKMELMAVDVVSMPAYPDTSIALRSLELHRSAQAPPPEEQSEEPPPGDKRDNIAKREVQLRAMLLDTRRA